jgi:hypothetical protein
VENERNQRRFESVYSKKVRAGKRRTYFFDVRKTKGEDFYLTLTESTKKFNSDGYERHKIFLYKEDFNRFLEHLQEAIDYVKENLMPEYDYDEFTRRHEEYDEMYGEEGYNRHEGDGNGNHQERPSRREPRDAEPREPREPREKFDIGSDDDISW